jgi:hypothetical protein
MLKLALTFNNIWYSYCPSGDWICYHLFPIRWNRYIYAIEQPAFASYYFGLHIFPTIWLSFLSPDKLLWWERHYAPPKRRLLQRDYMALYPRRLSFSCFNKFWVHSQQILVSRLTPNLRLKSELKISQRCSGTFISAFYSLYRLWTLWVWIRHEYSASDLLQL